MSGEGPNLHALGLLGNKNSDGGGGGNIQEYGAKAIVVAIERNLQALPFVGPFIPKFSGFWENSATSGLDLDKAGNNAFKPVSTVLDVLNVNPGALAKIIDQVFKLDLSAIKSLPVEPVSIASLGGFSPMSTGGASASGGMDIAGLG